ncbi:bile acid-sensitive ion channel-like [Tachypleus tridentatus]|uniref:bile acid-sensitive ion channel-like n=1 Tax=Tachypleus tridentatus TaxID=6853 RepID=UPI003FD40E90
MKQQKMNIKSTKEKQNSSQEFILNTSLHGVGHIARSSSWYHRLVWSLVLSMCLIGFILQVFMVIENTVTSPRMYIFVTEKDNILTTSDKDLPRYPAVTLCSHSPFKTPEKSSTVEPLNFLGLILGYPFVDQNRKELVELHEMLVNSTETENVDLAKLWSRTSLDLLAESDNSGYIRDMIIQYSTRCEEFFLQCKFANYFTDCCVHFETIITTSGVCFTFSPNKTWQNKMFQSNVFSVDFRIPGNSAHLVEEEGVTISLHDPREFPSDSIISDSVGIWTGMMVNLRFHLIQNDFTSKLSKFAGDSFAQCKHPVLPILNRPYTKSNCEVEETIRLVHRFCNCTLVLVSSTGNNSNYFRYCLPQDFLQCIIPNTEAIFDNLSLCNPACKEYRYEREPSYSRLGSSYNVSSVNRSKAMRLKLKHKDLKYVQVKYHYDGISEVVSKIGGSMGLLLGASVITVIEVSLFLLKRALRNFCGFLCCCWCCLKSKRR